MARSLSAGMITEVTGKALSPILLVKAAFDSGNLNVWTGIGNIVYAGDTYTGAGSLIGVSPVQESTNVQANGVDFSLRGIPNDLIALALTENYNGRFVSCFFACLDASGALVSSPYLLFKGRMDILEILESGDTSTLTMRCENLLIDLQRVKARRYTEEDQRNVYPLDKGLEFVTPLQDQPIYWGQATPKV